MLFNVTFYVPRRHHESISLLPAQFNMQAKKASESVRLGMCDVSLVLKNETHDVETEHGVNLTLTCLTALKDSVTTII
jgi:hypothetical protein